jgi:hypothetical protein
MSTVAPQSGRRASWLFSRCGLQILLKTRVRSPRLRTRSTPRRGAHGCGR